MGRCGKWDAIHANVKFLICCEVETLGNFQLSEMRCDDRIMVTEKVRTTGLHFT